MGFLVARQDAKSCFKSRGLDSALPQPISKSLICHKHLEKRFILPETQRLKGTAYPTSFTNDEVINGIPLIDNAENIDPRAEHNYVRNKYYDHTYCKDEPEEAHYADGRPVSETMANTAETVKFFDQLFDSVNGAATIPKKKGKVLRTAVTETSPHHQFWVEGVEKLEKIKYFDARGNRKSVPSLKNFISRIKTFINIQMMRPRYFNSDPLENFFGQIRAYNYRNNDPSCHSFMCTFKSLLITRMIKFHCDTYNCEDDCRPNH